MSLRKSHVFRLIPLLCLIGLIGVLVTCVPDDNLYRIYSQATVTTLKNRGNKFLSEKQPDSALLYYTMAAGKYTPYLPDSLKIRCAEALHNAGHLYIFNYYDYAAAYSAMLDALDITEECGDTKLLPHIYLNLGNIYLTYHDFDMMRSYYTKAFHSAVQNNEYEVAMIALSTLMTYAVADGNLEGISQELITFDSLQRQGFNASESVIKQRQAIGALERNDWHEAVNILKQASRLNDFGGASERFAIICDNQIAAILNRYHCYDEAIEVVKKTALDTASPLDMRSGSLEMLSELYASIGSAEASLRYRDMAHRISDSLFRSQQYSMIRDIRETRKIKKLDTQLMAAESKRRQWHTAFVVTAVGIVIVSLLIVLLWRQNRQLSQRNRDLFLRHRQLLEAQANERVLRKEQRLDAVRRQDILARIETALEKEELILSNDFSLIRLAAEVDSNTNYVSQVINDEYHKNFNTLLGELRVKISCRRLCDSAYAHLTIEAIAESTGFKSRSNFITVFKKVTGLTPSQYRKIAREEQDQAGDT